MGHEEDFEKPDSSLSKGKNLGLKKIFLSGCKTLLSTLAFLQQSETLKDLGRVLAFITQENMAKVKSTLGKCS